MDKRSKDIRELSAEMEVKPLVLAKATGKVFWYMSLTNTILDLFKDNELLSKDAILAELNARESKAKNELSAQSYKEAAERLMA